MTIDKSWSNDSNRNSDAFLTSLWAFKENCKQFVDPISRLIKCPCKKCGNSLSVSIDTLWWHLSQNGFDPTYTTWKYHGEPLPSPPPSPPPVVNNTPQPPSSEYIDTAAFFNDISADNDPAPPTQTTSSQQTQTTGPQPTQTAGPSFNNEYEKLLATCNEKVYPDCDMTTLDFTSEFSHIKVSCKITDVGFDKILTFLRKVFPHTKGFKIPASYYEIKKTYKKIGLGYESIHACINDCFLFWGSDANKMLDHCPVCKASRWKDLKTKGKKVANKVLRYFPLKPRLQRLFNSQHTAKWMTWHATGKSKENGKMNHPADGKAWKNFDIINHQFSKDPRNVRLGLAADGFNPFGNMSQNYSM